MQQSMSNSRTMGHVNLLEALLLLSLVTSAGGTIGSEGVDAGIRFCARPIPLFKRWFEWSVAGTCFTDEARNQDIQMKDILEVIRPNLLFQRSTFMTEIVKEIEFEEEEDDDDGNDDVVVQASNIPLSTDITGCMLRLFSHPGGIEPTSLATPHGTLKVLQSIYGISDARRIAKRLQPQSQLHKIFMDIVTRKHLSKFQVRSSRMHTVSYQWVSEEVQAAVNQILQTGSWLVVNHELNERRTDHHRTALHVAAETGNYDVVEMLLAAGSDPNVRDVWGLTPGQLALRGHFTRTAELLGIRDTPDHFHHVHGCNGALFNATKDTTSSGGWHDPEEMLDILPPLNPRARCEFIAYREDITEHTFLEILQQGHPTIIKAKALHSWLRKKWTRKSIENTYGHVKLPVSANPYSQLYGSSERSSTLRDFLRIDLKHQHLSKTDVPKYVFTEVDAKTFSTLFEVPKSIPKRIWVSKLYHGLLDRLNDPTASHLPQFYLGGPQSGAPMHFHQDALNVLMYGRKRWFLLPPWTGSFGTIPALYWYNNYYEDFLVKGGQEFIQEEGDIVYVPHGWGHAVLNLETSIGYAQNFESPYMSF